MKKIKNLFVKKSEAPLSDGPIYSQLLKLQQRVADYLNRKTANWSPGKTKVILIVFCLLAGNASLWLLSRAFTQANGPPVLSTPPIGSMAPGSPDDSDRLKFYKHLK